MWLGHWSQQEGLEIMRGTKKEQKGISFSTEFANDIPAHTHKLAVMMHDACLLITWEQWWLRIPGKALKQPQVTSRGHPASACLAVLYTSAKLLHTWSILRLGASPSVPAVIWGRPGVSLCGAILLLIYFPSFPRLLGVLSRPAPEKRKKKKIPSCPNATIKSKNNPVQSQSQINQSRSCPFSFFSILEHKVVMYCTWLWWQTDPVCPARTAGTSSRPHINVNVLLSCVAC